MSEPAPGRAGKRAQRCRRGRCWRETRCSLINYNPVHFFAECQAVNAFENLNPHGFFLTSTGYLIGAQPSAVDFLHADQPFNQIDGAFKTVGGSEPSYSIPGGGAYNPHFAWTHTLRHELNGHTRCDRIARTAATSVARGVVFS